MAEPILKHRMALTFAARADGETHRRRHRQAQERASDKRDGGATARGQARDQGDAARERRRRARSPRSMPRLILEARRIAATVIHGLHGRKRAGPGENFWQYRRFLSGEPARRVDWRRSARDEHPLRARAGMGGRAHGLDLGRPLALDGVQLAARAGIQARPHAGRSPSRSPRCWCRPASASACRA